MSDTDTCILEAVPFLIGEHRVGWVTVQLFPTKFLAASISWALVELLAKRDDETGTLAKDVLERRSQFKSDTSNEQPM